MDLNFWLGSAVTAVVFGLPIGLFANYAYPRLERWWSTRSAGKKERREGMVRFLAKSEFDQMFSMALASNYRHLAIISLVMAMGFTGLSLLTKELHKGPPWLPMVGTGFVMLTMGMFLWSSVRASRLVILVMDARQRQLETERQP